MMPVIFSVALLVIDISFENKRVNEFQARTVASLPELRQVCLSSLIFIALRRSARQ